MKISIFESRLLYNNY